MDVGQVALKESEIEKHLTVAQSLVTQFVVVSSGNTKSNTEIAGTRRRFVSTVSTTGTKSTNKVELANTVGAINAGDGMLSLAQHGLVYKTRRAAAVALAVGDLFAEQTGLDALVKKNTGGSLAGEEAERFRSLVDKCCRKKESLRAMWLSQIFCSTHRKMHLRV